MNKGLWTLPALALVVLVSACSRHSQDAAAGLPEARLMAAGAPSTRSSLAYEDNVEIVAAPDTMQASLAAAQKACMEQRFGPCSVLEVSQNGGRAPSARLSVRLAPKAVEPFIAAAAGTGEIGRRDTRAEDLADAVSDLAQKRDRAERERARLERFQERTDLKVQDMIALSERLAEIESQLERVARDSAQNQRRIETHKVSIEWTTAARSDDSGEIRSALSEFGDSVAASLAIVIRCVAFLLPFALVFGIPLFFITRRWRRARAARQESIHR